MPFMQFTVLLCLSLVMFIIAVARQTLGALLLSSLLWLAMAFTTYAVADPTSGLTQGSVGVFFILFFVMFVLSINSGFTMLKERAEQRQREYQEEIV